MMDQQAPNGADFMVQPGGGQGDAIQNGITIAANSGGSATPVNGTDSGSTPGSTAGNGTPNNNNEAKRVKLDHMKGNPPSRVIHIRNIPSDVTEAEIIHLGIPFGRVTNVLVLKGKNQAFLEMDIEESAVAMVNYFTNCVAQLRERSVYVQFSNHKELKTDQTHSNASASAQAALQAAHALIGQEADGGLSGASMSPKPHGALPQAHTQSNGGQNHGHGSGGPNTVLRVIVEHMVYPVTLDVIYQIFSRVGKVLKIVTFTKNNTFQALIQYPDVITAQAAKLSLDGQNIYNACCTLRIEYSKLSNLNVKYNNDKSRDYTNPTLPTGDPTMDSALGQGTMTLQQNMQQAAAAAAGHGSHGAANAGMLGSPFSAHAAAMQQLGLTNPAFAAAYNQPGLGPGQVTGAGTLTPAGLAAFSMAGLGHGAGGSMQYGAGGGGGAGNGPHNLRFPGAGHQAAAAAAAAAAMAAQMGLTSHGHYGAGNAQLAAAAQLQGQLNNVHVANALNVVGGGNISGGCVLLVSNLEDSTTECDHLFILFGVYGDVHRVKILFNKKDTALIQMAEPHQAMLAMNHLDKVKLWGKVIRVMPSKHTTVQLPKEGQPDAGLTKDFSSSSLHRFKKPGSKNYSNIYPPSATLHLSNIPSTVEEEDLKTAFSNIGLQIQAFKFFPKDRKMALVQLANVEDAIAGLVKLHNYQLSETSHLRVSFSKSTI